MLPAVFPGDEGKNEGSALVQSGPSAHSATSETSTQPYAAAQQLGRRRPPRPDATQALRHHGRVLGEVTLRRCCRYRSVMARVACPISRWMRGEGHPARAQCTPNVCRRSCRRTLWRPARRQAARERPLRPLSSSPRGQGRPDRPAALGWRVNRGRCCTPISATWSSRVTLQKRS